MNDDFLTTVAERYLADGYRVTLHPVRDELPDFLAGFGPQMLARKAGENVVVGVVTKEEMSRKIHFLEYWVGKVNSEPGWRFDMAIDDPSPWSDKIARDSLDPDIEEIRQRNVEALRALERGFLEPACLFAWALVEAALRVVAGNLKIGLASKMPAFVMKQLYSSGILSGAEFEQLDRFMLIRNSVAHGLKTPSLDESGIVGVMAMTDKLLSIAENADRRLAKA